MTWAGRRKTQVLAADFVKVCLARHNRAAGPLGNGCATPVPTTHNQPFLGPLFPPGPGGMPTGGREGPPGRRQGSTPPSGAQRGEQPAGGAASANVFNGIEK